MSSGRGQPAIFGILPSRNCRQFPRGPAGSGRRGRGQPRVPRGKPAIFGIFRSENPTNSLNDGRAHPCCACCHFLRGRTATNDLVQTLPPESSRRSCSSGLKFGKGWICEKNRFRYLFRFITTSLKKGKALALYQTRKVLNSMQQE